MDSKDIHTPRSFCEGLKTTGDLIRHIFTEDDYRSVVMNSARLLENDKESKNKSSVQYRLLQRIREYGTVQKIPKAEMEVIKRMANEQFPLESDFDACLKVFELQKRLRVLAAANVSTKATAQRGRKRRTDGSSIAEDNSARKRNNSLMCDTIEYCDYYDDDEEDTMMSIDNMNHSPAVVSGFHYVYS